VSGIKLENDPRCPESEAAPRLLGSSALGVDAGEKPSDIPEATVLEAMLTEREVSASALIVVSNCSASTEPEDVGRVVVVSLTDDTIVANEGATVIDATAAHEAG
jgi:hypothetical protein